jgi:hypothetical protein
MTPTPEERNAYLKVLHLFGGAPAEHAGLEVLQSVDAGKALPKVAPVPGAYAEAQKFEMPKIDWGNVGKIVLKLIGCAIKNVGLAIQGKWLDFAVAVWTCAFGS